MNYNIVLLDDNYIIRNIIKSEIYRNLFNNFPNESFDIYASEDGVGGLGYIYITKPAVIIVDTTLPKYSGKEIFEFLKTNPNYQFGHTLVVLISEQPLDLVQLPQNFVLLDKSLFKFLHELNSVVLDHISKGITAAPTNPVNIRIVYSTLGSIVLYFANFLDVIGNSNFLAKPRILLLLKPVVWFVWVLMSILIAPLYIFYNITLGNVLGDATILDESQVNYRSSERTGAVKLIVNVALTLIKFIVFLLINVIILLISREI